MAAEELIAQALKPGVVIPVGIFALIFYVLYEKFSGKETYEDLNVEDVTREHLREELRNAEKVDRELLQQMATGVNTLGYVTRIGEDAMPAEQDVNAVIDPDKEDDDNEELPAEGGIYKLKVRPADSNKYVHWIKEALLRMNDASDYYIVKDDNLRFNGDKLIVKNQAFLDYDRGIFKDRSRESDNKANHIIRLGAQKQAVEGIYNFGRRVMHLDPETTKREVLEKIRSQEEEDEFFD